MRDDQGTQRTWPQRGVLPAGTIAFTLLLSGCFFKNSTEETYGYGQNPYESAPAPYGQPPYQDPSAAYDDGAGVTSLPGDGVQAIYPETPQTLPPTSEWSPTPAGARIHTVVSGDNLYRIGKQYGVSMQDLMSANSLTSPTIHPGQELIIP